MELSAQEIEETEKALDDFKCKFYWTPRLPPSSSSFYTFLSKPRFSALLLLNHFTCVGCVETDLS